MNSRNPSLELLRVISMLGVVILHCFLYAYDGANGISKNLSGCLTLFLTSICMISVNVFALVSGYFSIGSRGHFIKIRKLSALYLMMLFYILLFLLIAFFSKNVDIHPSHYFPLKSDVYWFMTEYFQLMLIAPFLVRLVDCLDRFLYSYLLLILFTLTVVIQIRGTDAGFSLLWFVFLFLCAGFLRVYDVKIPWKLCGIIYVSSLLCYWILSVLRYPFLSFLFSMHYSNIFVFLMSVSILLCFRGINNLNKLGLSLAKLAPYTLGVYLIHEHPIVRGYLWGSVRNIFPTPESLYIILISVVVFCICALIEWLRQMLFDLLHVDTLVNKACDKMATMVKRNLLKDV